MSQEHAPAEMVYEEFAPSGPAQRFIQSWWRFECLTPPQDPVQHTVVPDGLVSLTGVFAGQELVVALLVGPSINAHVVPVRGGVRHAGIRLRVGAAGALLRVDPAALVGAITPVETICPRHAPWIRSALRAVLGPEPNADLERAFPALEEVGILDEIAAAAGDRMIAAGGDLRIAELAREAGLSDRRFRLRFAAAAGLTPKTFAVVRRQREAWKAVATGSASSLTHASHVAGYADQPHFTRATRGVFGKSPSAVEAHVSRIEHRFD